VDEEGNEKVDPKQFTSKGQAQQAKIARLRRCVRVSFFVLLVLLLYAIWAIAVLAYTSRSLTKKYDPAKGFQIELDGCNLEFEMGDEPKVKYTALTGANQVRWTNSAEDSNTVVAATFSNSVGCDMMPFESCERICKATVTLPPAADGLAWDIRQTKADKSRPLITVKPGTTMTKIMLGQWYTQLPTVSLFVDRATITGSISAHLQHGYVKSVNSTIADASISIYKDGSIYMLDVDCPGKELDLTYRNPQNVVCVQSDVVGATVSRQTDVWSHGSCDIRSIIDGSATTSNWASYYFMTANYDKDNDNLITKEEFSSGLAEIQCCGGGCPFAGWCERQTFQLDFPAVGPFGLTVNEFAARLIATNHTQWMPRCTNSLGLAPPSGIGTASTQAFSKLWSEHGEVVVTLKQGGTSNYGSWRNQTVSVEGAKLSGLRLNQADATRLATYAKEYGDRGSLGTAFMVLEVQPGPGYGWKRFVYATNPAFLTLNPAHVTFLSAGLLTPTIIREYVRFQDNDCALTTRYTNATLTNETLVDMHNQLKRALMSNGAWDKYSPLKGPLVLIGDKPADNWGNAQFLAFNELGEETTIEEWSNPGMSSMMMTSIALSTAAGAVFGILAMAVIYRIMAHVQKVIYQGKQAKKQVVLTKMGLSKDQIKSLKEQSEDGDKAPVSPLFSPFELCYDIFIAPVRRSMLKSIEMFVRRRLTVLKPAERDDPNGKFMYMRQFARQYELFCLERDLIVVESRDEIQRELIKRFDVRVQRLKVKRLTGIRWREQKDGPPPPTSVAPGAQQADGFKNAEGEGLATVRAFVDSQCVADSAHGSWIDMKTRRGPDGNTKLGFRPQLYEWCKTNMLHLPEEFLDGTAWDTCLPKGVDLYDNLTVRQLRGLRWKVGGRPKVSANWFFIQCLTVTLHLFLFFVPSILFVFYAFIMQNMWGVLMSPVGGIDGKDPVLWLDVARHDLGASSDKYLIDTVQIVLWGHVAFMAATVPRLIIYYLEIKKGGVLVKAFKWLYAIILFLHLLTFSTYAGVLGCWFILAAVLYPSKFLPYGIAVLIIVVVAVTMWTQMMEAAKALKEKLLTAFHFALQMRLRMAMKRLQKQAFVASIAEKKPLASSFEDKTQDEAPTATDPDKEKEITPQDLFYALQSEMESDDPNKPPATLSMEDFEHIFELLDLNITENQKDQLFAFCDVDCSGDISEQEFVTGWELMVQIFLEESAASLGLSTADIVFVVVSLVTILALVIAFVLMTLSAWANEGSFEAVIQSLLISGCGKATTLLRKRSKAEDNGNMDGLVKKLMKDQEDATSEGGA